MAAGAGAAAAGAEVAAGAAGDAAVKGLLYICKLEFHALVHQPKGTADSPVFKSTRSTRAVVQCLQGTILEYDDRIKSLFPDVTERLTFGYIFEKNYFSIGSLRYRPTHIRGALKQAAEAIEAKIKAYHDDYVDDHFIPFFKGPGWTSTNAIDDPITLTLMLVQAIVNVITSDVQVISYDDASICINILEKFMQKISSVRVGDKFIINDRRKPSDGKLNCAVLLGGGPDGLSGEIKRLKIIVDAKNDRERFAGTISKIRRSIDLVNTQLHSYLITWLQGKNFKTSDGVHNLRLISQRFFSDTDRGGIRRIEQPFLGVVGTSFSEESFDEGSLGSAIKKFVMSGASQTQKEARFCWLKLLSIDSQAIESKRGIAADLDTIILYVLNKNILAEKNAGESFEDFFIRISKSVFRDIGSDETQAELISLTKDWLLFLPKITLLNTLLIQIEDFTGLVGTLAGVLLPTVSRTVMQYINQSIEICRRYAARADEIHRLREIVSLLGEWENPSFKTDIESLPERLRNNFSQIDEHLRTIKVKQSDQIEEVSDQIARSLQSIHHTLQLIHPELAETLQKDLSESGQILGIIMGKVTDKVIAQMPALGDSGTGSGGAYEESEAGVVTYHPSPQHNKLGRLLANIIEATKIRYFSDPKHELSKKYQLFSPFLTQVGEEFRFSTGLIYDQETKLAKDPEIIKSNLVKLLAAMTIHANASKVSRLRNVHRRALQVLGSVIQRELELRPDTEQLDILNVTIKALRDLQSKPADALTKIYASYAASAIISIAEAYLSEPAVVVPVTELPEAAPTGGAAAAGAFTRTGVEEGESSGTVTQLANRARIINRSAMAAAGGAAAAGAGAGPTVDPFEQKHNSFFQAIIDACRVGGITLNAAMGNRRRFRARAIYKLKFGGGPEATNWAETTTTDETYQDYIAKMTIPTHLPIGQYAYGPILEAAAQISDLKITVTHVEEKPDIASFDLSTSIINPTGNGNRHIHLLCRNREYKALEIFYSDEERREDDGLISVGPDGHLILEMPSDIRQIRHDARMSYTVEPVQRILALTYVLLNNKIVNKKLLEDKIDSGRYGILFKVYMELGDILKHLQGLLMGTMEDHKHYNIIMKYPKAIAANLIFEGGLFKYTPKKPSFSESLTFDYANARADKMTELVEKSEPDFTILGSGVYF